MVKTEIGIMTNNNIFAEERKIHIVEYINKHTKATVPELCSLFHVSPATIRNDLTDLSASGLLSRVHGGAIANRNVNYEQNQAEASSQKILEKKAIAKTALKYIHEGDTISLDAGSSIFELASNLDAFHDLTIVTYDLNIATWLDQNSCAKVILAGGSIRKGFHYITGQSAIKTIQPLHVDIAFISANGVNPDKGLTTPEIDTADMKRLLIQNAHRVVLLADSQKIGITSFVKFADIQDIDYFITDCNARPDDLMKIRSMNVKVESVTLEDELSN